MRNYLGNFLCPHSSNQRKQIVIEILLYPVKLSFAKKDLLLE